MRASRSVVLVAVLAVVFGGCSGFGRKFNRILPEFLRSDPGADEVERYQTRVRVLNRTEEEARIARAAYDEGRASYEAEDWGAAWPAFESYLKDYPDTPEDKEARLMLARAYRADDEPALAAKAISEFIDRYPISTYNDEIETLAFELASEMVAGDHNGLLYSEEDTGIQLFEKLVLAFPNGLHAPTSHWRVANYYFDEERFLEAEATYAKIVENYPDSEWAARSQFNRGLSLFRGIKGVDYDEQTMTGCEREFRNYLAKYTEGDRRAEAQDYIARVREILCEKQIALADWYRSQDLPRGARFYYVRAGRLYPETAAAAVLEERLASLPDTPLEESDGPGPAPEDALPAPPPPGAGP
ncbi:MAG: outer membrane protein assembly factor BamD [Planctomycetota bacterium]